MSACGRIAASRRCSPPRGQRGIALLVAILLVALGTIIAAAIAYENAMTARRGAATFAFDESLLIAQGAEALAAYGLRQVRREDPNTTNLDQAWAKPLGPIEVVPGVMLEASLEDLSGRFNLNSLVKEDGEVDKAALAAFLHLLQWRDLEPKWATLLIDWIDPNIQPEIPDGAEDSVYMGQSPPYLPPNKYITSTTELLALPDFGRDRYLRLAPYVTALPPEVKLNVCTAPGLVLDAYTGTQSFGIDPEGLAKNRTSANGCFPKKDAEYKQAFESPAAYNQVNDKFVQVSNYFRLTSHVTIGCAEFNLYSLLYRDDSTGAVRPLLRSYAPD